MASELDSEFRQPTPAGRNTVPRRAILAAPILALLLPACSPADQRQNGTPPQSADGAEYFAADVAQAAKKLIDVTPEAQRADLVLPFDSPARTRGRDTSQTEAFCAVLQWCALGQGITVCSMDMSQRTALHALLNRAMSPGGYQALLAVMNRNRVIGEMEDVGDGGVVGRVLQENPTAEGAESIFDVATNPDPSKPWYPVVGGAKEFIGTGTAVDWSWDPPPGLAARYKQFCDYTIAVFGNPGDDSWAIRFEGHHITFQLTFVTKADGGLEVHSTPLFYGSFPMVIPEDPFAPEDTAKQWHWTKGQVLMLGVVHHLREFWRGVPEGPRRDAFIGTDLLKQASPLVLDTPPSSLVAAVAPTVDQQVITAYPHIRIRPGELSGEARWNLRQAFVFYIGAMNSSVGVGYLARFDRAVEEDRPMLLSWAGGPLDQIGSHHFTYAVVDDLLLEVLQSNQYSVQHDPEFTGNHLHSMLRDLSFDWDDPMLRHQQHDHTTTPPK
ncbi:DUF3500 domain-containing protein [Mycobacterium sp. CVI_P3]|uniref:DUF3500 domain-containing protein n=1 Tax=Mycobacterium pinniadriaticum TaxID=2994102 RepID=A0ABT3SD68_9MYCO|nr:DUF3500 domain-containing protein [Mycobacterium pinniadriaticum]MCX2931031.1 DUF3500 domain-containing protein [Mycobacterium pinniadriaticum]MCX2937455.1 DUF3500 domain-containing protein [Mycobacterium pinniadriaticum]